MATRKATMVMLAIVQSAIRTVESKAVPVKDIVDITDVNAHDSRRQSISALGIEGEVLAVVSMKSGKRYPINVSAAELTRRINMDESETGVVAAYAIIDPASKQTLVRADDSMAVFVRRSAADSLLSQDTPAELAVAVVELRTR